MHKFDMSRLTRRKPDIKNAVCHSYNWKISSHGEYGWAHDANPRFKHGHVGKLSVGKYGDKYLIELGYYTDWSGTAWEGWEDGSGPILVRQKVECTSLFHAFTEAEKLYKMTLVPLLLHENLEQSFQELEDNMKKLFNTKEM